MAEGTAPTNPEIHMISDCYIEILINLWYSYFIDC